MSHIRSYITATLSLAVLAACGTTRHYVDQPKLTVDDPY
jgi:hypothetical protein